jgi:hypothetical protein
MDHGAQWNGGMYAIWNESHVDTMQSLEIGMGIH